MGEIHHRFTTRHALMRWRGARARGTAAVPGRWRAGPRMYAVVCDGSEHYKIQKYTVGSHWVSALLTLTQTIAATANGFDQRVVPGGLQRNAQAAHMHVNRAFFDEHMVAPHAIKQRLSRHHAVRSRH